LKALLKNLKISILSYYTPIVPGNRMDSSLAFWADQVRIACNVSLKSPASFLWEETSHGISQMATAVNMMINHVGSDGIRWTNFNE
jgi:hypothetical protein